MKKIIILVLAIMSISLLTASQLKVYLDLSSDDAQGKELTGAFTVALEKEQAYDFVSEIEAGTFVLSLLTLAPVDEALKDSEYNTVYSLVVYYWNGEYSIYSSNIMGYFDKKNAAKTADSIVQDAMKQIGEFQRDHPSLFEEKD